jgi:diaminopimelate decarboxylase
MAGFMADLAERTGIVLTELNLGGGYGVRYVDEDTPDAPEDVFRPVAAAIREICGKRSFPLPAVCLEPDVQLLRKPGPLCTPWDRSAHPGYPYVMSPSMAGCLRIPGMHCTARPMK